MTCQSNRGLFEIDNLWAFYYSVHVYMFLILFKYFLIGYARWESSSLSVISKTQ